MENRTRPEQAGPLVRQRVRDSFDRQGLMTHLGARLAHIGPGRSAVADSAGGYAALTLLDEDSDVLTVEYKINLLAPAAGDRLEAIGTVLKSGRTLTVCQLEVYAVQGGSERKLVANGQQTLIRVNRADR